jgi:hypothetical protein
MGNKQNKKTQKTTKNEDDINILKRDIYIPPLLNYKFFDRRMPYTLEEMEISESEQKRISEITPEKITLTEFPEITEQKIKVIIDTDLGTDWDDAMALMYALRLPNIEILGITTNYGILQLSKKY